MSMSLNIVQKFIGFILLVSCLPLLVIGILSYEVSRATLRDEATHFTVALVHDQRDYLDLQLQQIESLIANLAGVESITDALGIESAATDTYTNLATQARIGYILDGYTSLRGLVSIDIFTTAGAHYHVGDTLDVSNIRTDLRDRIAQAAREVSPQVIWVGIGPNVNASSTTPLVITAARTISTIDPATLQPRPVATLLVNYSVTYLYEHFHKVNFGESAYLLIIDTQGHIIYHPDPALQGARINPAMARLLSDGEGAFNRLVDNRAMLIAYTRSKVSGWILLGLVPLETLDTRAGTIGTATILTLLAAFAVVFLATLMVSHQVVQPIRQITRRFQLYQAGQPGWQKPLEVSSGRRDEIGELGRWFNAFLESLAARQRAEAALRESEERYALAMQGANDGLWDWDLRRNQVHYSSRWKKMLGYNEEAIGATPEEWFERIHPDDLDQVRAHLAAHLAGHAPLFESEHRIARCGGESYCWVLARGLAVSDEQQRPIRMAGSLTDISARKSTEEHLRYQALHDPLTGLPNRAYLMRRLEQILHTRHSGGAFAALLYLDLDRFKIVNDSLGHAAGDHLLIVVAQRLEACLRAGDFVARLGGDEFALVLTGLHTIDDTLAVTGRIHEQLAIAMLLEGHEIAVQASIGIAFITTTYERAADLLRDADTALYAAKANGRGGYTIFDAAMHTHTISQLRLEAELRRAVERQELRVHYQPIVRLGNNCISGFEALVRWQHPERGLILPGEFIGLAEEIGLSSAIDTWVLHEAACQARVWEECGFEGLTISVNLSARYLEDAGFPGIIQGILAEAGCAAKQLQIEITESTAMGDIIRTIASLEQLATMGVQIAIDDFGTSYSSLGRLKRLPVHSIKIDRSFIHDTTESPDAAAITSAIIAMSHILGLRAIAEGVETDEQRSFLHDNGCDAIQGFLISRAIPAEEATRLLEQYSGAGHYVPG